VAGNDHGGTDLGGQPKVYEIDFARFGGHGFARWE
jgi:hypothetical protein